MAVAFVQATHNQEIYSTRQGMALAFASPVTVSNALIVVTVGSRLADPYPAGATSDPYAGGMPVNGPTSPVITNGAGSATGWTATANAQLRDADSFKLAGTAFSDESKGSYQDTYPSIHVAQKVAGVGAGETIIVMNAYVGPSGTSQDARGAAGVSIYNDGVNAVAMEFSGVTGVATAQGRTDVSNPARSSAATNLGGTGNLQIAVGRCKNGNVFSASSGWTVVYTDKCVGSQEHFIVAYKVLSAADRASFANPLGMEIAVLTLNLT